MFPIKHYNFILNMTVFIEWKWTIEQRLLRIWNVKNHNENNISRIIFNPCYSPNAFEYTCLIVTLSTTTLIKNIYYIFRVLFFFIHRYNEILTWFQEIYDYKIEWYIPKYMSLKSLFLHQFYKNGCKKNSDIIINRLTSLTSIF